MPATAYYFIQVSACTAVMYGYYQLFLRNKKFHQYNRFYLLSVLVLPWLVPLVRIPLRYTGTPEDTPIRFFNVIADNNSSMEAYVSGGTGAFSWSAVAWAVYIIVAIALLLRTAIGVYRIFTLLSSSPAGKINEAVIVYTDAPQAPFSFFKFIFWNDRIDISSIPGEKVLQHELAHVRQRHSIDKLVTALVLAIGWINPFFWLVRKEIEMIHEFIADEQAVKDDASGLAHMLLAAAYPGGANTLVNSFFQSPIKRRIAMITNLTIMKYPYLRRILVLPLACIVVALFAFRKQPAGQTGQLEKTYTIIVDPGHGGKDKGAMAADGTTEASIALEISKAVKEMNTNKNIVIKLLREEDVYIALKERTEMANREKADLYVSVHANTSEKAISTTNGIEVILPGTDTVKYKDSYVLANAIGTYMQKTNPKITLKTHRVGIWVLQHVNGPATLIECGYMSNPAELANLKTKAYQQELAKRILEGAVQYLHDKEADKTAK